MIKLHNESANFTSIEINDLSLYFSYETIIAFEIKGKLIIAENVWSKTTGKHLNMISKNKDIRVSEKKFKEELNKLKIKYEV